MKIYVEDDNISSPIEFYCPHCCEVTFFAFIKVFERNPRYIVMLCQTCNMVEMILDSMKT